MGTSSTSTSTSSAPPAAARHPVVRDLHGDRFVDDYFWLRQKTNPAVIAYLRAENAYTEAEMAPTKALQETLYREMVGRVQETDVDVPVRNRGWWYYSRTEQGKQYPILCRKSVAEGDAAAERVILDVNELAKGEKFMSLGLAKATDDGRLLAYATDNTGFRQYRLRVKDLESGRDLGIAAERVTSAVWAADQRTVFFTVEDPVTKRSKTLFRQVLGGAAEAVFEEPDERFSVRIDRTRSGAFLVMNVTSRTASEVRVLEANTPTGTWRLVAARSPDHEYELDHHGDRFYLMSNRAGRNFALFTAPVGDPGPERWTEVIPHRADTKLESILCFADHLVVHERQAGLVRFLVRGYEGGAERAIQFPEAAYEASPGSNPEFATDRFRYVYESPACPNSVFDHDLNTGRDELRKRDPVLGGFDPANYVVERLQATARDGTRVPISLLFRKGVPKDNSAPLFLKGYGSYGIPSDPGFDSAILSLVDRGVICGIAHIRGGGDLGKPWHDGGRMATKMNTFTDFIDCAEHLVNEGYTDTDRLVIAGGSAGGLLMGAVTNLRPDLFRAVVTYVPFVDVINTMLDETLPLTVEEFEEWGNPKVPEQYRWMRPYCPYTNLESKAYPSILVKTSLNDSQVMYWEPAKYVARLRTLKTDVNPLLLHVNMDAGHGGASGRYDHLRERAFDFAFVLTQVGLRD
jgi:oligopeptidase B